MTKAAARQAHKKAERTLRQFLDALPDRPRTASEEAERKRLFQAEHRACEACWHADDNPRRPRKASELRKKLREELDSRKQDPEPQPATPINRWLAAYHEAGHAFVAEYLKDEVLSVDLHRCMHRSMNAVVALAGGVTSQVAGFDDHHSKRDLKNARAAIAAAGGRNDVDEQLELAEARAKEILVAHWPVAQNLAAALFHYGQLTGAEVRATMRMTAWELQEQERYCRQHCIAQRPPRQYAA